MYAKRIEATSETTNIGILNYPTNATQTTALADATIKISEADLLHLERVQLLKSLDATGDCV